MRAIIGAASSFSLGVLGSLWWYRPIANFNGDSDGPKRTSYIMSRRGIPDLKDRPFLYDVGRHFVIFVTVSVTRAYMHLAGKFDLRRDANYLNFLKHVLCRNKPLITVSNHRSIMDDPPIFASLLPYRINIQPRYNRHNVCAQDYCFNPKIPSILQAIMASGNSLPIHRGGGINQKLLLDFARFVAKGEWCHVFPEGGVWQLNTLGGRSEERANAIGKLKWGVGKLIAHAPVRPIVIPFVQFGMEKAIPQDPVTKKIDSVIPYMGHDVSVRFGVEIHFDDLIEEHERLHGPLRQYTASPPMNEAGEEVDFHTYWDSTPEECQLYSRIALRIQKALESLCDEYFNEL